MNTSLLLPTLEATTLLGAELASNLFPGAVIAFVGPLGAGKTTLVRALATALEVEPRSISSPTFALVHEYVGRLPIYHFDTYRLPDVAAFVDLGSAEYFGGDGVCLIEWADRVTAALPAEHLRIGMEPVSETARRATLTGFGERYTALVTALQTSAALRGWAESAPAPSAGPPPPPGY